MQLRILMLELRKSIIKMTENKTKSHQKALKSLRKKESKVTNQMAKLVKKNLKSKRILRNNLLRSNIIKKMKRKKETNQKDLKSPQKEAMDLTVIQESKKLECQRKPPTRMIERGERSKITN